MLITFNKAAHMASNDWIMNNNFKRMWKEDCIPELA
jgi:hypothetical protein